MAIWQTSVKLTKGFKMTLTQEDTFIFVWCAFCAIGIVFALYNLWRLK